MTFKEHKSYGQEARAHSLSFQLWSLWRLSKDGILPPESPTGENLARALPLRAPNMCGRGRDVHHDDDDDDKDTVPHHLLASTSCLALGKVDHLIASYSAPCTRSQSAYHSVLQGWHLSRMTQCLLAPSSTSQCSVCLRMTDLSKERRAVYLMWTCLLAHTSLPPSIHTRNPPFCQDSGSLPEVH